ncbi:MAG: GDP-L-fucose synthase [Candidatus Bathyarchaeota archaeon]|nr:GDP-L-fucose synthase [Candidatus Bathyarchaeota archaeon]
MSFWADKRILLTGGAGFLGSAVFQNLTTRRGVLQNQIVIPRSSTVDLRVWEDCRKAVKDIDVVIHLAARVGGIGFNQKNPGTLFYDNILMGAQLMEASRREGVEKFVQVGTVCSYPKFTLVPFKEDDLWNGYPEETNAPYGVAKKSLLVMANAYRQQYGMNIIYLLPVNLYGPKDNFDLASSHVIPALIRKFVEAVERNDKEVPVWGSGSASREFLFVDDAAEGIMLATEKYDKADPVNLGTGHEIKIKDLVELISILTGFEGEIVWESSKPDGQPRRRLDVSRAKSEFGFEAKTDFVEGLKKTIEWYKVNKV